MPKAANVGDGWSAPDPQLGAVARHSLREENMWRQYISHFLIGGFTLIAISTLLGQSCFYMD